jgi:hypothetical protein
VKRALEVLIQALMARVKKGNPIDAPSAPSGGKKEQGATATLAIARNARNGVSVTYRI